MFNVIYFNVIVNNSHVEDVPLKHGVHFAEWFPAHAKGYREGEHKLLCLEDVVVACTCVAIFF